MPPISLIHIPMIHTPSPTIRLIAEMCAVSRSTVSLALRRDPRISAQVTSIVAKTAARVGYVPDAKLSQMMSCIARKQRPRGNCLGILLGNFFTRPDPGQIYPWYAQLHRAMARRAGDHGCTLDVFWLGQPGMSVRRMTQILRTRGVEGLIVVDHLQARAKIDFPFGDFAAVVIGHGLAETRLDVVGNNLHGDLFRARHIARERGYLHPGLALDSENSPESLHAWISSYGYHESIARNRRKIPACIYDRGNLRALRNWYRKHKPDVILGLPWSTHQDLRALGIKPPDDVGFLSLLQADDSGLFSGIALQYRAIAARAIDMVCEKLRRFERGPPEFPELVLINGSWLEGATLPWRIANIPAA